MISRYRHWRRNDGYYSSFEQGLIVITFAVAAAAGGCFVIAVFEKYVLPLLP
jgi:hypothetical protein